MSAPPAFLVGFATAAVTVTLTVRAATTRAMMVSSQSSLHVVRQGPGQMLLCDLLREGHLLIGATNLSLRSSRVNVAIAAILLL